MVAISGIGNTYFATELDSLDQFEFGVKSYVFDHGEVKFIALNSFYGFFVPLFSKN